MWNCTDARAQLNRPDRAGVQYREELVGKGDGFEKGDLVKIRYQVRFGGVLGVGLGCVVGGLRGSR